MTGAEIAVLLFLFLGLHAIFVPLFYWAIKQQQFRAADRAATEMVRGEHDYTFPERRSPTRAARVAYGILFSLFLIPLILLSVQTVVEASKPPAPLPAAGPAVPAKCPFL